MQEKKPTRFLLELPLEYQLIDSPIRRTGATLDVGTDGLVGFCPERLTAGLDLNVKIFFCLGLNDPATHALDMKAEVLWADDRQQDRGYLCELRFAEQSKIYMNELGLFLDNFSKSQDALKKFEEVLSNFCLHPRPARLAEHKPDKAPPKDWPKRPTPTSNLVAIYK